MIRILLAFTSAASTVMNIQSLPWFYAEAFESNTIKALLIVAVAVSVFEGVVSFTIFGLRSRLGIPAILFLAMLYIVQTLLNLSVCWISCKDEFINSGLRTKIIMDQAISAGASIIATILLLFLRPMGSFTSQYGDGEHKEVRSQFGLLIILASIYVSFGGILFSILEGWDIDEAIFLCFASLCTIGASNVHILEGWDIDEAIFLCFASLCTIGASNVQFETDFGMAVFPVYAIFGLLLFGMIISSTRLLIIDYLSQQFSLKAYKLLNYWAIGRANSLNGLVSEEQVMLSLQENSRDCQLTQGNSSSVSIVPTLEPVEEESRRQEAVSEFSALLPIPEIPRERIMPVQVDAMKQGVEPITMPPLQPLSFRQIRTTLSHASLRTPATVKVATPFRLPLHTIQSEVDRFKNSSCTATPRVLYIELRKMLGKFLLAGLIALLFYVLVFSLVISRLESWDLSEGILFTFNSITTIGSGSVTLKCFLSKNIFMGGITTGLALVAFCGSLMTEILSSEWHIHVEDVAMTSDELE
ncbi:hypothetical protein MP638_005612 [Amoeboaphelidium occidentale]|nr:hypothetical protein MP638_005612 [Amoeboaphelidium occidentale]